MTPTHGKPRAAALIVALALIAPAIHAQTDYPGRPMRMIVAFPPGAGADLTARTVAQKLSESYGQPVVVDNRAGANGSVGTDAVAKSTPDGYTLLLTDRGALGINPSLYRKLPYDPTRDFDYIGIATVGAYVLVANAAVGAGTLDDLFGLRRQGPTPSTTQAMATEACRISTSRHSTSGSASSSRMCPTRAARPRSQPPSRAKSG